MVAAAERAQLVGRLALRQCPFQEAGWLALVADVVQCYAGVLQGAFVLILACNAHGCVQRRGLARDEATLKAGALPKMYS